MPKLAQDDQADYEGELCFVISKDAKNVSEEDAVNYIGGYLAGNDVSSRKLQRDPKLAGTVPQWNFSKGFDGYAPLGPQIGAFDLSHSWKLGLEIALLVLAVLTHAQ